MTKDEALEMALWALEDFSLVDKLAFEASEAIKQVLAQPPRKWIGLTFQERCELWNISSKFSPDSVIMHDFAKDVEEELRKKNI